MPASSTDTRQSPPRHFNDYVLRRRIAQDAGLFPVHSETMTYVPGGPSSPTANSASDPSDVIELGFSVDFAGKTYSAVVVGTGGWACLLVDKNVIFDVADVFDYAADGPSAFQMALYYPSLCIRGSFSYDLIMLAPWATCLTNCRPVHPMLGSLTLDAAERIERGISLPLSYTDDAIHGVKYHSGTCEMGRYLLIRWRSSVDPSTMGNTVEFDVVIYENGTIEYRYEPRVGSIIRDNRSTSVGIFTRSEDFRDFSSEFSSKNTSVRHERGGTLRNGVYSSMFTFSMDGTWTFYLNYTVGLNAFEDWPARGGVGCTLSFVPPQNRRRQNRSIVPTRDAVSFVRTGGSSLFDDQKTVTTVSTSSTQLIEYPSMVPVHNITTSLDDPYSLIDLYSSGSIRVERTGVTPGLMDGVLYDSIVDGMRRSGR